VRYEIVAGAGQDLEGSTGRLALIDRQVRVSSSFSPAVPPTCQDHSHLRCVFLLEGAGQRLTV
jgi:hypothetical protein